MGQKGDIYYIDRTPLAVCHNRRIAKHRVFAGLAARDKTSMGWFFGFKLRLVFNHQHQIVALKLTKGNDSHTTPMPKLTKGLVGKLLGDKGYLGKNWRSNCCGRV
jgi:Transposase DDE domain